MEKEFDFQYSRILLYAILFPLFVLPAFAVSMWLTYWICTVTGIDEMIYEDNIVFIFVVGVIFFAILYSMRFWVRIPDYISCRKGNAKFYDNYVILSCKGKVRKIYYSQINDVKIESLGVYTKRNVYVSIITNIGKIKLWGAHKEEQKNEHWWNFSLAIMADELKSRIRKQHEISPNTEVGTLTEYANDYWLNAKEPDYAKAESLYRQALEEQPDNPEALTMYAEMLFMTGRDSEAEALYEQACEIDSSFAENPVNHYEALGNKEREAYWRNKMKIEVKKSNNTVFAKSITKKEKKRHKIVSIIEKKRYKIVSIICLLDFIFVVSVKLLMNNGSVDFFTGVILIVSGIIPCGIMACYILSVIVDWSYGFIAKYKHNIIRDFIFTLIFGIGMRGAGIVPMFVLIVISCVPTLLGLMVSNAILGNGICSGI